MFLIRLRFPEGKSRAEDLSARFKITRKFERTDYKLRKANLDNEFLETCDHHGFIPKCLRFKSSNKDLQSSATYNTCQKRLLKEDISLKRRKINQLEKVYK